MEIFILTAVASITLLTLFFVSKNHRARKKMLHNFFLELLQVCNVEVQRITEHGVSICTNESFAQVQLIAPGFSCTFMWPHISPDTQEKDLLRVLTMEGQIDLTINRFIGLANHSLLYVEFVRRIVFKIIVSSDEKTPYNECGVSLELIAFHADDTQQLFKSNIVDVFEFTNSEQYRLICVILQTLAQRAKYVNNLHIVY